MASTHTLSIDFETGSACDLKASGAAKYAEDPSTRIICIAGNSPWDAQDPERVWSVHLPAPGFPEVSYDGILNTACLNEALTWVGDGNPVAAWNAMFEFHIWNKVFLKQRGTARRVPRLDLGQLHDTMARAAYWGLPLSLDMASQALPRLGIAKDMDGHRLMKRMSSPRKTETLDDGSSIYEWWDSTDLQRVKRLLEYCANDVRTEVAIGKVLPALPDRERKIWLLDAKVNIRGIALDRKLVGAMQALTTRETNRLNREMAKATGGLVVTTGQTVALANWCEKHGLTDAMNGVPKDRLPQLIATAESSPFIPPEVAQALRIRQEAGKSSVAKLQAMEAFACMDGRMRGLTQYYGAFRTGRWAGRGPQLQNFPRSEVKDQALLVDYLLGRSPDPEGLELLFGVTPLTALSSALRGCLYVENPKHEFASIDFSQIEARVLAWLAGETKVLQAFEKGEDLYVLAAQGIYGKPASQITKEERQVGKVSVLACGYQGGVGAFQSMARIYGLTIPDAQAEQIKEAWRAANRAIVSYWYAIQDAALKAVASKGTQFLVGPEDAGVRFVLWQGHLCVQLPSGRALVYRDATLEDGTYGKVVAYTGIDTYTHKLARVETYGGKLVENITQAVARDIMADAMLALDAAGISILGSVHDEVLLDLDGLDGKQGHLAKTIMSTSPKWAAGLPVSADGYRGRRFKKG